MERLVDIHNHVLFNVDDGAGTIEESIEMLNQAAKNGITNVVATPHQYEEDQMSQQHERQDLIIEHFKMLQQKVKDENIPIELHLGSEIYYTTYAVNVAKVPFFTYEDMGKYVLIEFSLSWHPEGHKEIFYELIQNGITPVLAHPERYGYFWEIADDIIDLIKMGAVLQINAGSLLGYHGTQAKFISDMLLKQGLVHVIASDAHRPRRTMGFNMVSAAEEFIEKYPNIDIKSMISDNPWKIVCGESLEINDEPCYVFDKNKQYKIWRKFYFLHDVLGIGNKMKRKRRKRRF